MLRFVPSLAVLAVLAAQPVQAQLRLSGKQSKPMRAAPAPHFGTRTPKLLTANQPNRPPATNTSGDPSLVTDYGTVFNGVPVDGVGRLRTPVPDLPGYGYFCTASRIGPSTILTAAHCVTDEFTGALLTTTSGSAVTFYGPGSTLSTPMPATFTAASVVVRPEWRGFFTEAVSPDGHLGFDVALLNYSTVLPSWIPTYSLYAGNPFFQNTTNVGFGTYGNGEQGGVGFDGLRRAGTNGVDYYTTQFASGDWNILYTDFDDGTREHDAFCYIDAFFCDTGTGATEMGTAPGDSGGPIFVDGMVAGVTSFGTYFCLDANCDIISPPLADPNVTDGFGAVNGFAGVLGNAAWIQKNAHIVALATPEPATVALLGGGLLALAGIARRRRDA